MGTLNISEFNSGLGVKVMKVDGLSEEEMEEMRKMPYQDMKERLLEVLDERCGGIGTCWKNGYGVYSMYLNAMHPESIFVEVGTSCD